MKCLGAETKPRAGAPWGPWTYSFRNQDIDLPSSKTALDVPVGSPFPTRNDLRVGVTGTQILARYGEPTARVTAMQNGRIIERYISMSIAIAHKLTLATLERGVVASIDGPSR